MEVCIIIFTKHRQLRLNQFGRVFIVMEIFKIIQISHIM